MPGSMPNSNTTAYRGNYTGFRRTTRRPQRLGRHRRPNDIPRTTWPTAVLLFLLPFLPPPLLQLQLLLLLPIVGSKCRQPTRIVVKRHASNEGCPNGWVSDFAHNTGHFRIDFAHHCHRSLPLRESPKVWNIVFARVTNIGFSDISLHF